MYENDFYSTENQNTEQAKQEEQPAWQENNRYFDRVEEPEKERMGRTDTWSGANPYPAEPPKKKPRAKVGGFWKKAACAVLLAVIFGSVAGGTFYGICKYTGVLEPKEVQVPYISRENDSTVQNGRSEEIRDVNTEKVQVMVSNDYSQVVEEVIPAMVTILNTYVSKEQTFWGTYSREVQGGGTGIIIGENETELLVATNYHVVADTKKLEITFVDDTTVEGRIKGQDAEMDLAVVAIPLKDLKQETRNAIAIAKLGESEKLKIGQPAIVIGNALGIGISVTDGIISGLSREMTSEDGRTGTFIQTNAAVNHGNSGGALLNVKGEVIGIVSNKIDGVGVEGMGYAIPIDSASSIISELKERKTRLEKVEEKERAYLGVNLQTLSSDALRFYDMPSGAYVYEVYDGTAAKEAGIVHGDMITKVDGERVSSTEQVVNLLQYYRAGETIQITISRLELGEYVSHDLTVTLGKRED